MLDHIIQTHPGAAILAAVLFTVVYFWRNVYR